MRRCTLVRNVKLYIVFATLLLISTLAEVRATAQVTISNTGSAGSSGMLMTEGAAISTASGQDSIFADSSSHRIKLINNGGSAQPLSIWPCTTAGCISYAASTSPFGETALTLGATGVPLLSGSSVPQWGGINLSLQTVAVVTEVPNDTTTGTSNNKLAKLTPTGALKASATDVNTATYIVATGQGTSGNARLAVAGQVSCTMDATASNTEGFFVIASPSVAGDCSTTSVPANGTWIVGQMVSNSTTSGSSATVLVGPGSFAPPALTTAAQAGVFLPMISWPTTGGTAQVVSSTANVVTFSMFLLPTKVTVNHISTTVMTTSATATFNIAIYDSGGNRLIDSGPLACNTAQAVGASVGSITLQPGTYYIAAAATDSTCAIIGITNPSNVQKMANLNGNRAGTSASHLVSPNMPNPIGSLTAVNGIYLPIVFIEP